MTHLHFFLRLLLLGLTAASAQAEPLPALRLCHELEDLPPYINTTAENQALPQPGLVLELIERAASQAQVRLELHRQPWKRCIHELQQGASDGIFVAIWEAERDAWGRFPGRDPRRQLPADSRYRLWQADYSIIVRKDSTLRWDGERFQGVQRGVGAPLGYVVRQRLQELDVLSDTPRSMDKALNLIVRRRLDGFVIERQIAAALIARLHLGGELTLLPQPLLETDWYVPLSHQFYLRHPELAERFWQALGEQRERLADELGRRYLRESNRQ